MSDDMEMVTESVENVSEGNVANRYNTMEEEVLLLSDDGSMKLSQGSANSVITLDEFVRPSDPSERNVLNPSSTEVFGTTTSSWYEEEEE